MKFAIHIPMFEKSRLKFVNDDRNTMMKPNCSSGILTPDSSTRFSALATVVSTLPPKFTPRNVTSVNASVFVRS